MPLLKTLSVALVCLPAFLFAQEFDKKAFCKSLQLSMTALETSHDSLKGEYVGENSFGIQQWNAKILLQDAFIGIYEHSSYLSNEYRATYVLAENADMAEAAALYKQLVSATRSCYGADFFLEEKVTTEYRGGKKAEQLEAVFTRMAAGRNTGFQFPYIRISSTAYETGETFEVLVELISQF